MAVVSHLANKRQGTQSAKTRSEVSGGGRKPWSTVFLSITNDFFGPGTAPFTKIRLFSVSTRTISRFCTVTLTCPICPGIVFPLNTRPGVVAGPFKWQV